MVRTPKTKKAEASDGEMAVVQAGINLARTFTLDGFKAFYFLIHNMWIPPHAERWVKSILDAKSKGKGIVIEAFRGSTKTTTVTITFTAWCIGLNPARANLLIQVGDDIATDNTRQIADIIDNSPAWKLIFPDVVPDKALGWGAGGYEVRMTEDRMPYADWRRRNAARKDPTLVGVGYKSREIIGKHPDGLLIVDDIHDENNTSSEREMETVRKILTGTIFPTMTPDTLAIFIGTPWRENDCLKYVESTGEFEHIKTPVYEVVEGEKVYAWPSKFGEPDVERQRKLAGEVEFARMFKLDLDAAKGINLKREWIHLYPSAEINPSWPTFFGIDYASTADKLEGSKRDYFAMAIGRAIPGGGLVVVDGLRAHLSKGEALDAVIGYWAMYPMLKRIGVETVGKGEEFYNDLMLTRDLMGKVPPLIEVKHGRRSKGDRFQNWLAPRFQAGRIWLADKDTPFMKAFKDEWVAWPLAEHDDCLDAVYMLAFAGESFMPSKAERTFAGEKERATNPLYALGRT